MRCRAAIGSPVIPSESRKEATSPVPFLSSKKISKIGTWNVITMFEANKAAQIARERRAYNTTVLRLCEMRWTQSGQVRLNTGEIILSSGHEEEDAHHTEGVAFMLSDEAHNALINWEAVGPRIIYASFKTKKENIKLNSIQTTRMKKQKRTFTTNCRHCVTN